MYVHSAVAEDATENPTTILPTIWENKNSQINQQIEGNEVVLTAGAISDMYTHSAVVDRETPMPTNILPSICKNKFAAMLGLFWWLSVRLWYLHCISNGDMAVYHWAINLESEKITTVK